MKQDADLESQMLDALELFQYAHRYRNQILVFVLQNEVSLENLIPDLKVISRADIVPVVICQGSASTGQLVKTLAERGLPLVYLPRTMEIAFHEPEAVLSDSAHSAPDNGGEASVNAKTTHGHSTLDQIRELLAQRTIPVIGFTGNGPLAVSNERLWEFGISYSHSLKASRAFVISDEEGLKRNNALLPLLSHSQLKQLRQTDAQLNVEPQLLDLIQNSHEADEFDIVLLAGCSGNLFQEIFTHLGSGTLFTAQENAKIGSARR